MSNAEMWSGIIGVFLPLVIAAVNRPGWSSGAKALVTIVACLLAAAGTAWFTGQIDAADVARSFLIVFTLAIGTYQFYWRPSGVAPTVERAV